MPIVIWFRTERGRKTAVGTGRVFGFTEKQIASFGMTFGVTVFMLYMLFIVWKLARDSGAGKVGTVVLFFVLGLGMLGFIVKGIFQLLLDV